MRNRFVLTRIVFTLGILLTTSQWLLGQELPPSDNEPTVTVTGRVNGPLPLANAESLAVLLLPGWSDALSAEIAAGRAPMVPLESGRMERIVTAPSGVANTAGVSRIFEFRDVQRGEYQAVAVKVTAGAVTGAAIAVGSRVVVDGNEIRDLDLEIREAPKDQAGQRHGGAQSREPIVLDSVNRPPDTISPIRAPAGPASVSSGPSRKKELLEQILVGVAMAAFFFSMW